MRKGAWGWGGGTSCWVQGESGAKVGEMDDRAFVWEWGKRRGDKKAERAFQHPIPCLFLGESDGPNEHGQRGGFFLSAVQ